MNRYTPFNLAQTYRDIEISRPFRHRLRSFVRNTLVLVMGRFRRANSMKEWIRFPFYHSVFDDERRDFKRQLRYFKDHGDFITLSDAVATFENKEKIGGRYFCITFDDGFKNCATNALPILVESGCRATFFVPTDYIGCEMDKDHEIVGKFFSRTSYPPRIVIEFMNWDDCTNLLKAGMIIGAHTCSHVPLSELTRSEAMNELLLSKQKIEEVLGVDCCYFSAPWGVPGKDLDIHIHPILAKKIGFRAFLTTERGPNDNTTDPFLIRRDFLYAKWGNYQLRYLFS